MTDWGFWIKVYIDRLNLHVKLIGEKAEGGSLTLAGKLDLDPSKKSLLYLLEKIAPDVVQFIPREICNISFDQIGVIYSQQSQRTPPNILSVAAVSDVGISKLELFYVRTPSAMENDSSGPYAVGVRFLKPIYLRDLPFVGAYINQIGEFKEAGITNLGFIYASHKGTYPMQRMGEEQVS